MMGFQPTLNCSTTLESVLSHARKEAERHKWIESEKAGYDKGEDAIRDWDRRHFPRWCRDRWLEHLQGVRRWKEFRAEEFGLLNKPIHDNLSLVIYILSMLYRGGENLNILLCLVEQNENVEDALEILKVLNINSARLSFSA